MSPAHMSNRLSQRKLGLVPEGLNPTGTPLRTAEVAVGLLVNGVQKRGQKFVRAGYMKKYPNL